MRFIILTIICASAVLLGIMLQKVYTEVPVRELKRRAQKGDRVARTLYRAVAYGSSLTVLLWLMIGVGSTGLFFVVVRSFPWPVALISTALMLAVGLLWLPHTRVSKPGRRITLWMTPLIAWKLNYLHRPLEAIGRAIHQRTAPGDHTQLYQKEDLVDLLKKQSKQADSRITKGQLDMAVHALTFGDKLVRDTLTPFSQVKTVKVTDSLGPLLMNELHKNGHSRFPVYDGKKDNIVGLLYLRDLLQEQKGGLVKDIMHRHITYVHEDQTLYQTLQAFLKTKRHLFIVVNEFEEMVGIITIEDVIEQIIGHPIMDEFDQYENLRAVATRMTAKTHKDQKTEAPKPGQNK